MQVQAFFKLTKNKNNKTQHPFIKNNIVPFKRGTHKNDICKQTVCSKTTLWRLHFYTYHFINAGIFFLREKETLGSLTFKFKKCNNSNKKSIENINYSKLFSDGTIATLTIARKHSSSSIFFA